MTSSNITNIKHRYFYTEPLAAAWMAKHFGMRFTIRDGVYEPTWQELASSGNSDGYFVHQDSLYLLQPLIGDIVLNCDDDPARVISNGKPPKAYCVPWSSAIEHVGTSAQIISRRGKAFHWPESDEV